MQEQLPFSVPVIIPGMDVLEYLARLHYVKPLEPDAQTLRGLHLAHMLHVPFENLDIGLKRPIRLDQQALWEKLIVQGRGGFCYELNGMFAWLLKQAGFDVTYLNARVYGKQDRPGIDFDHLALLVRIPEQAGRWLVDVGFGDSFHAPLDFAQPGEQVQGLRAYRLEQIPKGFEVWQKNYEGVWKRQYLFDLQPRRFPVDYEAACTYHQTSPDSSFTRGSMISRATPTGRVSLEDGWLILTENGQRSKQPVRDQYEYHTLLKHYFNITLSKESS